MNYSRKDLEDLYSGVAGKPVMPRKHLKVFGEAIVTVKFDGAKEVIRTELEDTYARKVLGFTANSFEKLDEHISKWLRSGNWSESGVAAALPQIKQALMNSHDMNDPKVVGEVAREVKLITEKKLSGELRVLGSFLQNSKNATVDLFDMFNTVQSNLSLSYITDRRFLSEAFEVDFSENKVAVGPGEVVVTLFSEAYNPSKGDLAINGIGEIEVKASQGRLGNGAEAVAFDKKHIKGALDDKNREADQLRLLDELRAGLNEGNDKNYSAKMELERIKKEVKGLPLQSIDAILKIANSKGLDILDDKDVKARWGIVEGITKKVMKSKSDLLGAIEGIDLVDEYHQPVDVNKISELIDVVIDTLVNIRAIKTGGMTRRFNSFWSAGRQVEDQVVYEYMNEGERSNQRAQNYINEFRGKLPPAQLVGAIMMTNYQKAEGFAYIMLNNTNEGVISSGRCPTVVVGMFGSDYAENLRLCLESISLVDVTPNVDRGSGFNVTPKP